MMKRYIGPCTQYDSLYARTKEKRAETLPMDKKIELLRENQFDDVYFDMMRKAGIL